MEESLETPTASFETSAQPKFTQKKSQRESVDVNHRFSAITFLICDKYYRSVRVCCGVGSSLRVFWSVYERLNWMWACFLLGCFYSCWAGLGTDCHACSSWKSWKIQFDQGCVTSPDRVCVLDCISTWERVVLGHMGLNVHFLCCMDLFWAFTCSLLGEYTVKNIKKQRNLKTSWQVKFAFLCLKGFTSVFRSQQLLEYVTSVNHLLLVFISCIASRCQVVLVSFKRAFVWKKTLCPNNILDYFARK